MVGVLNESLEELGGPGEHEHEEASGVDLLEQEVEGEQELATRHDVQRRVEEEGEELTPRLVLVDVDIQELVLEDEECQAEVDEREGRDEGGDDLVPQRDP